MFDFFEMIAKLIEGAALLFERFFEGLKFILSLFGSWYVFMTAGRAVLPPFLGALLGVLIFILFFVTILRLVGDFFL